jgi:hypothetical protein
MRTTTTVVLGLALLGFAPAFAQQVRSIEIIEYGIYISDFVREVRGADGTLSNEVTNPRHMQTTTTVLALLGNKFGFRYHISGTPEGAAIELRKIIIAPSPGLKPPGASQPMLRHEQTLRGKIGETSYTANGLDKPWMLVLGKWTIQLWQGSRMLAEQSFTVVAP